MPENVVDSKKDHEKWEKAKEQAKKQGKGDDYGYIMTIYKKMDPDGIDKDASIGRGLLKAASRPPNYRRANGDMKCENCKHFNPEGSSSGHCEAFDVGVDAEYVCEEWEDTGKRDADEIDNVGGNALDLDEENFATFEVE